MIKYIENEEDSYLLYIDANNLYGWVVTQKMPIDNIRWMSEADVSQITLNYHMMNLVMLDV